MLVYIKEAKYIKEYKAELKFNNGETGIVDLKNVIFNDHRSIFKPLRDVFYFKRFQLNSWTLTWPNHGDFAPEFLYQIAIKARSNKISV